MTFALRTFLSRILVRPRRHYRFFGFVIGYVRIGVIWPARKADRIEDPRQPEFPGMKV